VGDTHFHVNKAERNEQFYQVHNLSTSNFNEWAIVVLFYASMHYVDAVLCQDTSLSPRMRDPDDHKVRNLAVSQCSKLNPIAPMYINLRDRCWEARYYKISFPSNYLGKLENRVFKPTRTYLRKTLGLP
jgi:hypothetical protein